MALRHDANDADLSRIAEDLIGIRERHRQVNGASGERRRVLVQMGVRRRRLCWRSGARQQSRGHAKRGGLQPLQILDKGCERGSRLDREPTGTIAPAELT